MRKRIVVVAILATILTPLNGLAQERRGVTYAELKACLTNPPNAFVEGTDFVLAAPTRVDYYTNEALAAGARCASEIQAKKSQAASLQRTQ